MSTTVGDIVTVLKQWAPLSLKESWDNPGLLIGDPNEKVEKVLTTLDVMMDTVDYAIENGVQMIVSHHPVIFNGLKSIRTDTYSGKMYQKLLAHHIAVFSAHTNLDSADGGVNDVLAGLLGLQHTQGLVPVAEDKLYKLAVYVPESHAQRIRQALGEAGAGFIGNYRDTSFSVKGEGRFQPQAGTHPFIGSVGKVETVDEERIETIVPESRLPKVLNAMLAVHPYEEPAYDLYPLKNAGHPFMMGRIGDLPQPQPAMTVLQMIKKVLHRDALAYAGDTNVTVEKVALLGGGGAEFIGLAKQAGAQLYLTGDVKYHDAQEAVRQGIVVADGGHFGTEHPVVAEICRRLSEASEKYGWQIQCATDPTSQDMLNYL